MRAEDVKVGAWYRGTGICAHIVGRVSHRDGDGFAMLMLRGGDGHMSVFDAWEPWVPRVGEWVRDENGVGEVTRVCMKSRILGMRAGGVGWASYVSRCEPCAPPEAKPETRAGRFVREATPGQIVAAIVNDKIPPEAEWQKPIARDHNATCSRCGGRAYQGIGLAKCVEPVCDDPETREPDAVSESMRYPNARCEMFNAYGERVYEAVGRGRVETHPTREGAIAAWRKAVRRG